MPKKSNKSIDREIADAAQRVADERGKLITLKNERILELELELRVMKSLSKVDIERLARVAWENTGKGELPVLPPGHGWVDGVTKKPISEEELVSTWEKVGTKDIFRRQAAAVAQALGFKLGADAAVTSRDLIKGAQAPMRAEIAKLLVQQIVRGMERESALLQPDPQVFMRDPYALLDLIRKEANVSAEDMDAWMLEAQPNRRGGHPRA
jgi:hypothetical protein